MSKTSDSFLFLVNFDRIHTREHFLEMLLESGDVLAVAHDLQKIFVANEVEPYKKKYLVVTLSL